MGRIRRNRKGFTLIELIVAIGIMLILAAVATPFLLAHIKNAKVGNLNEQILNIKAAFDSYYTDKGGLLEEGDNLGNMVDSGWLSSNPSGKSGLNWAVIREKDNGTDAYIDVIEVSNEDDSGYRYLSDIVAKLNEVVDGQGETNGESEGTFRYCDNDNDTVKFRFMLRKDAGYPDTWAPTCSL